MLIPDIADTPGGPAAALSRPAEVLPEPGKQLQSLYYAYGSS